MMVKNFSPQRRGSGLIASAGGWKNSHQIIGLEIKIYCPQ
jgi:hypothetical protein